MSHSSVNVARNGYVDVTVTHPSGQTVTAVSSLPIAVGVTKQSSASTKTVFRIGGLSLCTGAVVTYTASGGSTATTSVNIVAPDATISLNASLINVSSASSIVTLSATVTNSSSTVSWSITSNTFALSSTTGNNVDVYSTQGYGTATVTAHLTSNPSVKATCIVRFPYSTYEYEYYVKYGEEITLHDKVVLGSAVNWTWDYDTLIFDEISSGVFKHSSTVTNYGETYIISATNGIGTVNIRVVMAISEKDVIAIKSNMSEVYPMVSGSSLTTGAQVQAHYIVGVLGGYEELHAESHQLYQFVLDSDGYYFIYPLHTNNMILNYNNSTGKITANIYNGTIPNTARWKLVITRSGSTYYMRLKNKGFTTKYFSLDSNTYTANAPKNSPINVIGAANGEYARWKIFPVNYHKEWNNGYQGVTAMKNVVVTAHPSAVNAFGEATFINAVAAWNGISDNVKLIYKSYSTSVYSESKICFYEKASYAFPENIEMPIDANGMLIPYDIYGNRRHDIPISIQTWQRADIVMNKAKIDRDNLPATAYLTVATHELGHALKLSHISDNEFENTYYCSYPSIMQIYTLNYNGTTYVQAYEKVSSYTITTFDKTALRRKWGSPQYRSSYS